MTHFCVFCRHHPAHRFLLAEDMTLHVKAQSQILPPNFGGGVTCHGAHCLERSGLIILVPRHRVGYKPWLLENQHWGISSRIFLRLSMGPTNWASGWHILPKDSDSRCDKLKSCKVSPGSFCFTLHYLLCFSFISSCNDWPFVFLKTTKKEIGHISRFRF